MALKKTYEISEERGNALFLILIAVALFAALSYAITQSGRGGGNTQTQQNAIYAAQIVQIGADMKANVLTMIVDGTPATSIVTNSPTTKGFAGSGTLNVGHADFCTTGTNCLFAPAPTGGGVAIPMVPRAAFLPTPTSLVSGAWTISSYFAGTGSFNGCQINGLSPGSPSANTAIAGIGTGANDDIMFFYPLTQGVCLAIDQGLGLSTIPTEPSHNDNPYTAASGMESACLHYTDALDTYVYYQVLVVH